MRSIGKAEKALKPMVKNLVAFSKPIAKLGKNVEVISEHASKQRYVPQCCKQQKPWMLGNKEVMSIKGG